LPEESSYPYLIDTYLEAEGIDWIVINAGVSGDTTAGGLRRLPWLLKSEPDVVFVALGANDGLRGIDLRETKKNLKEIIRILKKEDVKVLLSGMELPTNYGESYRKKFRKVYSTLAKKEKIPFYPFLLKDVAMIPKLNLSDGIHPNAKGQERIAKNVYTFLKPLLTDIFPHPGFSQPPAKEKAATGKTGMREKDR